ncbi:MAG: MMPL family transporter [Oceanococcaceae bacterium]
MAHGEVNSRAAQLFVRYTEPLIFSRRWLTLLVLGLMTVFFAFEAAQLRMDTGFEKQLPLGHPYMGVYQEYQKEFGGANIVLMAVMQKDGGDIYTADFMATLEQATRAVYFMPGVDRSRVSSLFTPNVRYMEVVESGFQGGNVVPSNYQPTADMLARVRSNVARSDAIGRLVANDQTGAMIFSELVETDPVTGARLDYMDTEDRLEQIRQRFLSPERYEFVLKEPVGPLAAGTVVRTEYQDPRGLFQRFQRFTYELDEPGAEPLTIRGSQVDIRESANPDFNPNVDVAVIGFAKAVGDIADSAIEVFGFFGITLLLVWILLSWYCGSLGVGFLPLACGILAVVWELGMLHAFGFGLDPFAVLMPFIVLAISTSHGIQITNFWLNEVADHGLGSFEASRATYRRLVIPGISALATNFVGFGTILLIPIGIIQEMAINAMFGLIAIVLCKKVLLPCLLSFAPIRHPEKFRDHQHRRDQRLRPLWRALSVITLKPVAIGVLAVAVGLWAWAEHVSQDLQFGELHDGVPELRPDARYNVDSRTIAAEFAIGVDVIKIIAQGKADGCIDHTVMQSIDDFAWHMENVDGVQSTMSLAKTSKQVYNAYNENNPKWHVLPRESGALVVTVQPFPSSTGLLNDDCSAIPIFVYSEDHKAETIDRIIDAANAFIAAHPDDSPVTYRLATGNVGVMAAANDVIRETEPTVLGWLFLGIGLCILLAFRSVTSLICILVPLWLVSIVSYAVMVYLEIGVKVSNLAMAAFAAGIGVDYGIYILSVLEEEVKVKGKALREAYEDTLHQTGKAVVITAATLAASVCTWFFSTLQFQVDMGFLLTIMFIANAVAAVVMLPAFAAFFLQPQTSPPPLRSAESAA